MESFNNNEENKNYDEKPDECTITTRDGQINIFNIEVEKVVRHRDGKVKNFITARRLNDYNDNACIFDAAEYICLEIPFENRDILYNVLAQYYSNRSASEGYRANQYNYIGNFDADGVNTGGPSQTIRAHINELDNDLENKLAQKKEEDAKRAEEEKNSAIKEGILDAKRREVFNSKIKEKMINNPKIVALSNKNYIGNIKGQEQYDCTNIENGEILRLRNVDKIGKDRDNRYLYRMFIKGTPNACDVELLNGPEGLPVIFTMPGRLSDIVSNEQYPNGNVIRENFIKLLSHWYEENKNNKREGILYDIGGISNMGAYIHNNERNGVSGPIIHKIHELQKQYANENIYKNNENR